MKKNLANIISCVRIIGASILLLFYEDFSNEFLIIYAVCAFTDALDGFVARKLDICSTTGVVFDTIGDLLTGLAPVKVIICLKLIRPWFLILVGVTILMFLSAAIISQVKFKKFSFPHTYFDKLLGCCVSASPFIYRLVPNNVDILFIIVGTVFFIAGIEIIIIELKLKEAKPFVPSIFHTDK